MGPDPADDLPRVTPSLLRQADEMCRRRLAHEHTSGRKLSPVGDGPFEVSSRLTQDAITWHKGGDHSVPGFPDPLDLEPEQRAVYAAASGAYVRLFGDTMVDVHDLGWSTDLDDIGVRLVCSVGIAVVSRDGTHELRLLRIGARALVDHVELQCLVLRAHEWAPDGLRVVAADLLENESAEYEIDVGARVEEARAYVAARVDVIRARADPRHTRAGADCRFCPCIPGCPQITRSR